MATDLDESICRFIILYEVFSDSEILEHVLVTGLHECVLVTRDNLLHRELDVP